MGKKKPRQKDWPMDDWGDVPMQDERKLLRGKREQRNKVARLAERGRAPTPSGGLPVPELDESPPERAPQFPGLVVEVSSGLCRVQLDENLSSGEEPILCTLRGTLFTQKNAYSHIVAVGDRVLIATNGDGRGVVETVFPRRSVLSRPAPMKGNAVQQIVVANADQVMIVTSWREPNIWPELIDRYLIATQRNALEALIVVNKKDLVENPDEFQQMMQVYENLNWKVVQTSTLTGAGINELHQLMSGKITVLAGLSGVGKSSLLMTIAPDLNLRVGAVSQHGLHTGQGRHTTTQSSLWHLCWVVIPL